MKCHPVRWLVQVRGTGEPWRTVHAVDDRVEAERLGEKAAAETLEYGEMRLPHWPYVRLSHRLFGTVEVKGGHR